MLKLIPSRNPISARGSSHESGQGVVEYILLLFFVAAIASILAVALGPVKKQIDFMLADYFYCLIDEGELPGQGDQSSSECQQEFSNAATNLASGTKRSETNNNNKSENQEKSSPNTEKSTSSDSQRNRRSGQDGSDGGAAGPIKLAGANNNASSNQNSRSRTPPGLSNADGSGGSNSRNQGNNYLSGASAQIIVLSNKNVQASGLSGLLDEERKRIERRDRKVVVGSADEGTGGSRKAKRLLIKPIERKVAEDDSAANGFSFGKIFRIIFIIAIIIAIVMFVGGQLAQINKSME